MSSKDSCLFSWVGEKERNPRAQKDLLVRLGNCRHSCIPLLKMSLFPLLALEAGTLNEGGFFFYVGECNSRGDKRGLGAKCRSVIEKAPKGGKEGEGRDKNRSSLSLSLFSQWLLLFPIPSSGEEVQYLGRKREVQSHLPTLSWYREVVHEKGGGEKKRPNVLYVAKEVFSLETQKSLNLGK